MYRCVCVRVCEAKDALWDAFFFVGCVKTDASLPPFFCSSFFGNLPIRAVAFHEIAPKNVKWNEIWNKTLNYHFTVLKWLFQKKNSSPAAGKKYKCFKKNSLLGDVFYPIKHRQKPFLCHFWNNQTLIYRGARLRRPNFRARAFGARFLTSPL